ncbi:DUF2147 domain-containing protein [Novilysobacter selenitireducens]|uniref:DUF2147 domain-containing protein n=1 Tax=Novilysobacter selenitireducens TaxID=2872639 RepID=A0ABS7T7J8_9GAMM|nr:DUF2147 domain-containing protein [Lysobacter selenitireducens]MBZ4039838.1 DUF2147 domain-containing protein [Lysobacter selenitireducens]
MRNTLLALLALPLMAVSAVAMAQNTPVGSWTTIDDETGKPKSVVEIYEARDGSLAGRVDEILQSDRGPNPVCDKCSGANKDKPVKGMVILWGIKQKGNTWEGGKILDPASGKVYSVKVTPTEGGSKLEVRGFMGFSLLGRTQTWVRQ